MANKTKLTLAVFILLATSIAVWKLTLGASGEDSFPRESNVSREEAAASRRTTPESPPARADAAGRRLESAPLPAARSKGSLLVRIVWASDKSPAAGIVARVIAHGRPNAHLEAIDSVSTNDGTVRIESLPPGAVDVQLDRGGVANTNIAPGRLSELTLEVPVGITIAGTVVDPADQPVADAEIWLFDPVRMIDDGMIVGRTAADGSLQVRDVTSGRPLGARSSRFAPSPVQNVYGSERGRVELRLRLGEQSGDVAGLVLDPSGRPVANAAVLLGAERVGRPLRLDDGTYGIRWDQVFARTQADGRFRMLSVRPGKHTVDVRARGLALGPWKGQVEVGAGATVHLEVQLAPGVTLMGTVRDAAGKLAAGALVRVGGSGFGSSTAPSGPDGEFRLDGLAPGEIRAAIEGGERGGVAKTFENAAPGAELTWDAVLDPGLQIKGRVLDGAGAPLAAWSVLAQGEARNANESRSRTELVTDAEGRFTVTRCRDVPHSIDVRGAKHDYGCAGVQGIRPGGDEVVIRVPESALPSAWITGTVVDQQDKPVSGAVIVAQGVRMPRTRAPTTEDATGRFRIGQLPPGTYKLAIIARGFPDFATEERALAAGETWELGNLRLAAGGSVVVSVADQEGSTSRLGLTLQAGGRTVAVPITLDKGKGRSALVAPGAYVLQVAGRGFACQRIAVEVRAGEDTKVEVVPLPGTPHRIRFEVEGGGQEARSVRFTVRDGSGATVFESQVDQQGTRPMTSEASYAPGEHRVEATTASGRRGEASFRVDPGSAGEEVVVTLR